ncbi:MAG TPA: phenylalanine--tRNA ligase beta subunit-related protein [Acidimicrobiia bacterium]|nr:phenylalanine--tRNA ligase beta subunit-related protein [Acidimicrobiia bacterium]
MFAYDTAIAQRFPAIRGGVIHATGLGNGPSPTELLEAFLAEQQVARGKLDETPIAEIPSIEAWRRAFTAFGVKPTQHRVAAESLLRRLQKTGDVPSINTLVDMANLVSVRYALPVAVFDQATVNGSTTVRFATGQEQFTDLGATATTNPAPGEVIFVDDDDIVTARRWCWRQSSQSATSPHTTNALITVEALHEDAKADIEAAVADLLTLLDRYQPQSEHSWRILSADKLVFTIGH